MREHQIVITLKPEQFTQVQKLAKNAGAKSMGMFVRQQLLAALGIEGDMEAAARVDLEPALQDLRRLHAELKGFVAESLASFGTDFVQDGTAAAGASSADSGELMAALAPLLDDELEKTALQTFAISPRLGAVEKPEEVHKTEAQPAAERSPVNEAVNDKAANESEFNFKTPWTMPARHNYDFYGVLASQDEEPKRDPLSELLGDEAGADQSAASHSEDDDSFDVPLSILARRQQLQAQKKAIEGSSGLDDSRPIEKPAASVPPAKPLSQNSELQNQARPNLSESASQAAPAQTSPPPARQIPGSAPLDNPEDDPPLSGGPPPKKRQ